MQSHTKFARLSRQAMTLQHGHLLQDSGFIKRGSTPTRSEDWVRTSTSQQAASSFLYGSTGTVTGRLSSGRPAIQNIPRADLSTSARQFREIASMYSIEEQVAALRSALQKTYSLPSRSESPALLLDTQSWAQRWGSTRLLSYLSERYPCYSGLIQTQPETLRSSRSVNSFDWLDLSRYELLQPKTQSITALRKSGE